MAPAAALFGSGVVQESFLLGSRSLIPLSGSWWDKSFEVCWSRRDLSCWYDVLALPRAGRRSLQALVFVVSFAARVFSPEEWVLECFCPTNRSAASLRRDLIHHGFQI